MIKSSTSELLTIHQLQWWGLVRGPYLRRVGVLGLQVLYILKLGESGKVWRDLHSDSVESSDFQHLEGSQPLGASFWLGSWRL